MGNVEKGDSGSGATNEGGASYPEGEHAVTAFPATCLGEKCPNFEGTTCTDSFYEWVSAKATVEVGRDLSQPPLLSEAVFVTYGQLCVQGNNRQGIRYRVDDYGQGHYSETETGVLMHGDSAFGEGTDVNLFGVQVADDGSVTEELRHTYEGWDGVKIDLA